MILKRSLAAWESEAFNAVFKAELEAVSADELPLQQGLSLSSSVSAEPFQVMVINASADEERIQVKAGIFFTGIIAGCSCSDDPSPTDRQSEYCEVECVIDRRSGETTVRLLPG